MYDEELAPDIQKLAQAKLKQARQGPPVANTIKPAAALPTPPSRAAGGGADDEQSAQPSATAREPQDLNHPAEQKAAASRFKQLARQRRALYKEAHKMSQGRAIVDRYKRLRNILRIAKIGTGLTVAGLILTVLMAHGEWIYHKFNKNYPFTKLDKILTLAADGIILLALTFLIFIVYLYLNAAEATWGVIKMKIGL